MSQSDEKNTKEDFGEELRNELKQAVNSERKAKKYSDIVLLVLILILLILFILVR